MDFLHLCHYMQGETKRVHIEDEISDNDPQRRALIKQKTNKYLSYAEEIYKNHLCDSEQSVVPRVPPLHCPLPAGMVRRGGEELALYRVLAALGAGCTLVHRPGGECLAMKVIRKVPNNLTEFDEYFLQRTSETRIPTLPTLIPYMVPLHAYIETDNLIFLLLSYAAGEKLFDYIKNYVKSVPNTPAREVNLENVFTEPKLKSFDVENNVTLEHDKVGNVKDEDVSQTVEHSVDDNKFERNAVDNENVNSDSDNNARSVDELVFNSQKLLSNVDKVLTGDKSTVKCQSSVTVVLDKEMNREEARETASIDRLSTRRRDVLPPSAIRKWGAEILTALESLHNSGVVCRDLNPSNILLGEQGQIILTYFYSYPGLEMSLSKLRASPDVNMYIAPELYVNTILDDRGENECVCDFWSFGAVMYQLICGVPLSDYHRTVFTTHTILQLPEGMTVEEESLLTQLLTYEPSERLGGGKDGIAEIKRHPYFKTIDWQAVYDSWIVPD